MGLVAVPLARAAPAGTGAGMSRVAAGRWSRWLRRAGAGAVGTAHAAVNARLLRRPDPPARPGPERSSVLLPVRDEAAPGPALPGVACWPSAACPTRSWCSTTAPPTAPPTWSAPRPADPRVTVLAGQPLPPGWLGKPHACQQLADAADPAADVLVFLDADVVLGPDAVAAAVGLLRRRGDLVCAVPAASWR